MLFPPFKNSPNPTPTLYYFPPSLHVQLLPTVVVIELFVFLKVGFHFHRPFL